MLSRVTSRADADPPALGRRIESAYELRVDSGKVSLVEKTR